MPETQDNPQEHPRNSDEVPNEATNETSSKDQSNNQSEKQTKDQSKESRTSTKPLKHLVISYGFVNTVVFVLSLGWAKQRGLDELIGALFLLAGIMSIRRDDDNTTRYGVKLGGIFPGAQGDERSLVRAIWESLPSAGKELGCAFLVGLIVFPIYALGWPLVNVPPAHRLLAIDGPHLQTLAINIFAVGLTEEMYFRGYVQTKFCDVLGLSPHEDTKEKDTFTSVLQALYRRAIPIVATAVLFAITHVTVQLTAARAATFFPALLFGAVRVWRRGIGAAIVLHAFSNVFEAWLEGK